MLRLPLERLPDDVPEVGTIVEITAKDKDVEKGRFHKGSLAYVESYRARVISITKRNNENYNIKIEGMVETIFLRPGVYAWLSLSQFYVNLAF